jgi:hypothetical protein
VPHPLLCRVCPAASSSSLPRLPCRFLPPTLSNPRSYARRYWEIYPPAGGVNNREDIIVISEEEYADGKSRQKKPLEFEKDAYDDKWNTGAFAKKEDQ